MIYTTTIEMPKKTIEKWNELLKVNLSYTGETLRDYGYDEDCTVETYTGYFIDGSFADIKLCAGQNNFFGDNILFDASGYEVCVPDCFGSIESGDFIEFEYKGDLYIVEILAE